MGKTIFLIYLKNNTRNNFAVRALGLAPLPGGFPEVGGVVVQKMGRKSLCTDFQQFTGTCPTFC